MPDMSLSRFFFLFFVNAVFATPPLVDYNRMGTVGLIGAFAGLDIFENLSSIQLDPSASTLFSRDQHGSLTPLASTNDGGRILTACLLKDTFYIAGSFSSLGGITANNIVSYTVSSGAITA